ncbi:hypothetical protein LAZ67_18002480 [Cordylochernes scorpioides]|uniref:Transposase n=1 Tax=Cordylochernes scorpioides TaxID=51811 RepID=A0ABY6LHJ9_9ARAC|nr:hypothetical protein LAZ67_18002480 [Cordylochernes scorpioides]
MAITHVGDSDLGKMLSDFRTEYDIERDDTQWYSLMALFCPRRTLFQEIHKGSNRISEIFQRVYGNPAISTVKKWAAEFERGRTSLKDGLRYQVGQKRQPHLKLSKRFTISCWTIGDRGNIEERGAEHFARRIRDVKALRKVGSAFAECRSKAKTTFIQCLDRLKRDLTDIVRRIVTMDETWVHYTPETEHKTKHGLNRDLVSGRKKINFQQDNAPAHKSVFTMRKLRDLRYNFLSHLLYSPVLTPSDFHLFSHLNKFVFGKHFTSNEEVERAVDEYFNSLPDSHFQ